MRTVAGSSVRDRLLVIDDDARTRDLVHRCARPRYDVTEAVTLEAARWVLSRAVVHLVVVESRLPDGSGLSLLAEVAQDHPTLPTIMMTASRSEKTRTLALKLGVKGYLRKPVDAAAFLAAVNRLPRRPLPETVPSTLLRLTSDPAGADAAASGGSPSTARTRTERGIRHAVRFMRDHHAEPLTLPGVARTVGLSKFSLSHGFTAIMHVSFRAYLIRLRVTRAATLLRQTSYPVIEISGMVGFGDLSRFNKAFKKYMGGPPMAYRRQGTLDSSRSGSGQAAPLECG